MSLWNFMTVHLILCPKGKVTSVIKLCLCGTTWNQSVGLWNYTGCVKKFELLVAVQAKRERITHQSCMCEYLNKMPSWSIQQVLTHFKLDENGGWMDQLTDNAIHSAARLIWIKSVSIFVRCTIDTWGWRVKKDVCPSATFVQHVSDWCTFDKP